MDIYAYRIQKSPARISSLGSQDTVWKVGHDDDAVLYAHGERFEGCIDVGDVGWIDGGGVSMAENTYPFFFSYYGYLCY